MTTRLNTIEETSPDYDALPMSPKKVKACQAMAAFDGLAILLLGSTLGLLCYGGLIRTTFGGFDEARHMMNAVFFADLYRDLPITGLATYAIEYFIRFPALSFSWHPPMFPALAGIVLLSGGLKPVLLRFFVCGLAIVGVTAWYFWVLGIWGRLTAFLSGLLFVTSSTICTWAAAIMLDLPAVAAMTCSLLSVAGYLKRPSFGRATLLGVLLAAMLLTKQTTAFMLPVFFLYPIFAGRVELLWARTSLPIYLLVSATLLALAVHTWTLGSVGVGERLGNLSELAGAPSRLSLERWVLYARVLYESFGWAILAVALVGSIHVVRRPELGGLIIFSWVLLWYVAFSLTSPEHADALRYTSYVAPPIFLLAARSLGMLPAKSKRARYAMVLALFGLVAWSAWRSSSIAWPAVSDFAEPARFVHNEAGDLPVLYCCRFDGEFIFARRRLDPSRRGVTLRADKILVNFSIHPAYGMTSLVQSKADILKQLDRYGIVIMAIESEDNLQVPQFSLLRDLVEGPEFDFLAEYPITGNFAPVHQGLRLNVYRYRDARPPEDGVISVPAPQLGKTLHLHTGSVR